jgi:quercetin dioxygenase-like cupin family protein
MNVQTLAGSPRNGRGGGRVSHLLLIAGQFGSRQLSVTWVECQPGSQQALHAHPAQEQAHLIVHGRGQMVAGAEACEVGPGTLVFMPPAPPHAIRNIGGNWCMCPRPHRRSRPPSPARHGRSPASDCEIRPAFTRLGEMRPTMTGEGADGDW